MSLKTAIASCLVALVVAPAGFAEPSAGAQAIAMRPPPNIIVILADDVGYGDLGCYGSTKIKTPNLDLLAAQGVRCTDAYAPSAVCTPTRFAMLTGKWAWRQKNTGILPGDAPLCIKPGTVTLPTILKKAGYTTGLVGKWHLGLGTGRIDFNRDLKPGPLEVGFDDAFFFPATNDRVPTLFVENHRVVGLDPNDPIRVSYKQNIGDDPTGNEHPELLTVKVRKNPDSHLGTIVNGVSRIGWMSGGKAARWNDEAMTDIFTARVVKFIEDNKARPFFLYFAPQAAHEPYVPAKRFRGTSQCGVYGDMVQELDWSVGEITKTLDRLKLTDNTLLIFSSDNGAGLHPNKAYLYDEGGRDPMSHRPNGALRGGKGDQWEGGTRVPFIARWPGQIKPGNTSSQILSLVDLPATCAALLDQKLPANAAPDSVNVLPALLGTGAGREFVIEHHYRGSGNLAIRKGPWKLIPDGKGAQLYNLAADLSETKDVAAQHPEIVKELTALLNKVRADAVATAN